jgi:tRNA-2-methylthio-N6-dimethylallyladenosine synthase
MRRTYTRDQYLEKIALIRRARRPVSITTDLIVGFPAESDDDFAATLSLLDEVQYDGAFSFKFSPRPNTAAQELPDVVPEEEKSRRLAAVQEKQRVIQTARNQAMLGRQVEVLVDARSTRVGQWSGRTGSHQTVNFVSPASNLLGAFVQVAITRAGPNSLVGELV